MPAVSIHDIQLMDATTIHQRIIIQILWVKVGDLNTLPAAYILNKGRLTCSCLCCVCEREREGERDLL